MSELEEVADKRPESAAKWRGMLKDAEKADRNYHDKCDNIDDLYANLERLAKGGTDRQMQIFWANLQVLFPAIYSRPPSPVAEPRFKDRKELPRKAADVLERALTVDIELDDLHGTLSLCRDDLGISSRGVAWVRLGERDGVPAAISEHVDRKDYRCEPARKEAEVGWKARQAFMSRKDVEARFKEVPPDMKFEKRKVGDFEGEKKAAVWELWHKEEGKVVWVCEDCQYVLDMQEPYLNLTGFFPSPRPAYGTLQRGTLTPVPDFVYYRDQVEEINEITAKIAALQDGVILRGFYAAGNDDLSAAIEAALKDNDNRFVLKPLAVMALGPGTKMEDLISWMPVEMLVNTIAALIEQRRVLIDDVYQITGLSDIMRGATDPDETLGAQQLKSQYGSIRVKERQQEMQRLARDIIRLKAEIMCEEVPIEALLEMAQVDDIPTEADLAQQAQQIQAQAQQAIQQVVMQAVQAMQQPQMPPEAQGMPPPEMAPQGASMQAPM
jgi:hypothetical protein